MMTIDELLKQHYRGNIRGNVYLEIGREAWESIKAHAVPRSARPEIALFPSPISSFFDIRVLVDEEAGYDWQLLDAVTKEVIHSGVETPAPPGGTT